jgi:hypothetical protein
MVPNQSAWKSEEAAPQRESKSSEIQNKSEAFAFTNFQASYLKTRMLKTESSESG